MRWAGLLALGAGAVACAAVAVAAAGEPLRGADGGVGRLTLSPWLLVIPGVAVLILGIVGMASLRGVEGARVGPRRSRWLTIVGLIVLAALLSRLRPDQNDPIDDPTVYEIAPVEVVAEERGTTWPTWLVVGACAVVAAGALLARRRTPTPDEARDDDAAVALLTVEASMADLAEPADPRQAVIAAYARLLEGLRDVGAGRQPAEAPFEHVSRVLSTHGVRAGPLRTLTGLFTEARFSTHTITEDHRSAAWTALDEARADIQGVAV